MTDKEIKKILETRLNKDQLAAVTDSSRHILCLACAGSGKSRTLAYKIAYLIAKGADPESIVAFTFTEKAAESIKRRVAEALAEFGFPSSKIGLMFIGTLDAYCQKLLGDLDAKYRQYEILDFNTMRIFEMYKRKDSGIKDMKGGYFDNLKGVAKAWETMNNENIELEDIGKHNKELYGVLKKLGELLDEHGYMDFSYAVRLSVRALKEKTGKTYIDKVKYLFVDEYQDINPIQEEFIKILASGTELLFVVGDDDQAIFGWRGANIENILTFKDRYTDVSEHKLLTNYRSNKAIVESAGNFVQEQIGDHRMKKDVVAHSDGNIEDIRKLWFDSPEEEADWVAERIESLIGTKYVEGINPDGTEISRGLTYSDFAVLLRNAKYSHKKRDAIFAQAMAKRNIPFRTSGEGGIFDREYANCVFTVMEKLRAGEAAEKDLTALFSSDVQPVFPNADRSEFVKVMEEWGENIHKKTKRSAYPQQFFHDLMEAFKVKDISDMAKKETALRDLGLFSKIVSDYEMICATIDKPSLNFAPYKYEWLLNYIYNIAKSDYELEQIDNLVKEDAVSISTIHKAKGLEFPVVFVVDLNAMFFPHDPSSYRGMLPAEVMKNAVARGAYGTRIEDEARLFYTAITRAERCLYLTGSTYQPGEKKKYRKPSSFYTAFSSPVLREDKEFDAPAEKIAPKAGFDAIDFPTDFSSIKSYLKCPYSYKLGKIYDFSPVVPALVGFGKSAHTILEKLLQEHEDGAPSKAEIDAAVNSTFMLKHAFQSKKPGVIGPYEIARESVRKIMHEYVSRYAADFGRLRQEEARFELPIKNALVTGAIDLLLVEDPAKNITSAEVIDFKSMDVKADIDWQDMSVQVQLYSKAVKEVFGEDVLKGQIHTLKDNIRTPIPVDSRSVDRAIAAIEWAVQGILNDDFPMRPCADKCKKCDFKAMCSQKREKFRTPVKPLKINTPNGLEIISAFKEE